MLDAVKVVVSCIQPEKPPLPTFTVEVSKVSPPKVTCNAS